MIIAIFFVTIAAYLSIGYVASRRSKHLDDYYIAGRQAGPIFVMGTFAATWVSAVGILGYPGASYAGGLGAVVMWGAFPGFVIAALFIAPKLYRSGSWTLFDLFAKRWNDQKLAILAVIFMFFGMFPYLLSQVMGGATILSGLTGINYSTMVIISCIVFCVLTLIGGAWSVTVTDTAMLMVILFVAFVLLPFGVSFEGGWNTIMSGQFAVAPERFQWTGAILTPGMAISTIFIWMCGMFAAPHQSSRILIAKDEKTAIKGMILAITLGMVAVWSLHIMGHGLWSLTKDVKPADQALIYLFKNIPQTPLGALGISALFAAALSTTTTMLLTLAMGAGKDLYKRLKPETTDEAVLKITKWAVVGFTVLVFFAAYSQTAALAKYGELGSSIFACVYFPPLIAGLNWRRVTRPAVYASMIVGAIVCIVLWIAWRIMAMPLILGLQPVIYGIVTAFIALITVSLLTTPTAKEIEEYERLQKPAVRPALAQTAATAEKPDNFKYFCVYAVVVGLLFIFGGMLIFPS